MYAAYLNQVKMYVDFQSACVVVAIICVGDFVILTPCMCAGFQLYRCSSTSTLDLVSNVGVA
jgi:hypothetical protein